MGGSPSISGGMTQAEYQAQLDEQRAYSEAQEKKMREFYEEQMIKQEETARQAAEQAKQEEINRIAEAEAAEDALQEEIAAQTEEETAEETTEGDAFDFYSSLYQGLEERPE
jgi:DNA-binding FadR family transcriptional regulator